MNYFDRDAISSTLLKAIIKQSPHHAIERMRSFEPTPQMKLGTALHASILEPERYDQLVCVRPEIDRRTKSGKVEYQNFLSTVGEKTEITSTQQDIVEAMTFAIEDHPMANSLIKKMKDREVEKYFTYEDLACKAKIDLVSKGVVVDLKTTIDASQDAFSKQSANLLYHLQLAWYAKSCGLDWNQCDAYIIAVENTSPHSVAVYRFERRALELGWQLCKRGIRLWKKYLADIAIDGKSLAYGSEAMELYLPAWAEHI